MLRQHESESVPLVELSIGHEHPTLPSFFWSDRALNILNALEFSLGIMVFCFACWFMNWFSPWEGLAYTEHQSLGLTLYIFLFPIAFILFFDSITRIMTFQTIPALNRVIILLLMGLASILVSIWMLVKWNGKVYLTWPSDPQSPNVLLRSLFGFEMFLMWLPIGITLILISMRLFKKDKELSHITETSVQLDDRLASSLVDEPSLPILKRLDLIFLLVFMFIILPGFWIATTLIPNGVDQMQTPSIIAWQKTQPDPGQYIDYAKVNGRYLRMYPDVYVFYFVLFLTLVGGYVGRQSIAFRRMMRTGIFHVIVPETKITSATSIFLSVGQALMWTIYGTLFVYLFIFWRWYHSFVGVNTYFNGETDAPLGNGDIANYSRVFGVLATVACGLLLIPVSRCNAIVTDCFGISFESAVKFHRWLGGLFLIFSSLHIILMLVAFWQSKLLNGSRLLEKYYPFGPVPYYNFHSDNYTIAFMYYVVIFCLIPVFVILALIPYFRRRHWEVFYFAHIWGAMVLTSGLLIHATNGWFYMIPGVFLQFVERLVRLWKTSNVVSVEQLEQVSEDITKLTISLRNDHYATKLAGYCFVSLPNIDPFQFHPFSVSNSLNHTTTEFLIKDMKSERGGRPTEEEDEKSCFTPAVFTRRLRDLAVAIEGDQNFASRLSVVVEGPYGVDCDFSAYDKVVLIAGGIGITPMHNVFATIHDEIIAGNVTKMPDMVLLWVVRYPETFAMFQRTLDSINQHRVSHMELMLYATRGAKHSSGSEVCDEISGVRWRQARPDLKKDLAFLENYGSRALVYACGPEPLIIDAKTVAYDFGCHFRRETFEL